MKKKTKIVATIGPASESKDMLNRLYEVGVDAIRINFSHGDHDEHRPKISRWREIADTNDTHTSVIADLAGPEIRTGDLADGPIKLAEGEKVSLTTPESDSVGDISVNYSDLPQDVSSGDEILIDDGAIALSVEDTAESKVSGTVTRGGEITSGGRGVNIPSGVSLPALTKKDKENLVFALDEDVDFVALSFVKEVKDVELLRSEIENHENDALIISKIETQAAVENIDEIIDASDAIMVARGDLAVEIAPENVPAIQKEIIEKCNVAGVPVITATQMLESMTEESTPTRAEVSDVANAVLDGTDAVMLSGETAIGDYPVRAVSVMDRVARKTEASRNTRPKRGHEIKSSGKQGVVDSVTSAVVDVAFNLEAKLIVALTDSGFTARMLSRYKPPQNIVAFSRYPETCRRLSISYGCRPRHLKTVSSMEEAVKETKDILHDKDLIESGDRIVFAVGFSPGDQETGTNTLLIETV